MFFFPYGTDAPIYHWPITTVLMIAMNMLVFCAEIAYPDQAKDYILVFGNGLHPAQWITSNFMHAGIMHLLGNMLALWSFGLVVEGKLGCLKTLVIYLGIGLIESAILQTLMLGADGGGALGASGIIFGLMAMSLIWAPENNMQCVFVLIIFIYPRIYDFEVTIMVMVALMLGIEIFIQTLTGMAISSQAIHIIGAAIGFAVAIALLKARLVDCENWDAFSVWAGKNSMHEDKRAETEKVDKAVLQQQQESQQKLRETALAQIHEIIQNGQPELALKAHHRMLKTMPGWSIPENDLFNLILALHKKKLMAESIPIMVEYLKQHPQKSTLMRLKFAQILVTVQNRPAQALKIMAKINESELDDRQREYLDKLRAKASQLHEKDPYEIAEFDC